MTRSLFRKMPQAMILAAVCAFQSLAASAQPQVVASIKPLQMIAHAITDGVSEPGLLIPPNQDYHHFVLRPSTMRELAGADLLIWVGPELETYMTGAMRSARGEVIQVLGLQDLNVFYSDEDDQAEVLIPDDGLHAGHQHKHGVSMDPHVWLDTRNARLLAAAIADSLSAMDPANAARYQNNLQTFELRVEQLEADIRQQVDALRHADYAVYHNAFQYFEREFGLHHDLVFVESEELQPGVRHMVMVRQALESRPLVCLMEDVTAQSGTVQSLLGNSTLRRIQADTTGQTLASSGPDAYIELMSRLAAAFSQCINP